MLRRGHYKTGLLSEGREYLREHPEVGARILGELTDPFNYIRFADDSPSPTADEDFNRGGYELSSLWQ